MESISGMEFEIVKAVYFLDDNFTESDIEKYVVSKVNTRQNKFEKIFKNFAMRDIFHNMDPTTRLTEGSFN